MSVNKKQISALTATMLAATALAACGGDDSPETPIAIATETTAPAALTRADYIDQADPVCAEADASIANLAAQGQGVTGADQIADLRQSVLTDLKDLGPPNDADRATLDKYLSALENMIEAGRKIALASERGEDTAAAEADLDSAKTQAQTAATDYGFKDCGQPIDASASPDALDPGASDGGTVTPAPAPAPTPAPPADSGGGTGGGGGVGIG